MSPCFSRKERTPCGILFNQVVFSQPNGVSFYGRPHCRASVDELPDPHFKIKQFAFRVASSSAHLPLEEPLLWRALDTDRDLYRSIRPAPVQEPHAVLPLFRKQQQANVWPRRRQTVRLPLRRVAGFKLFANRPPNSLSRLSDPLRSASSRCPYAAGIPSCLRGPNRDNRSRRRLALSGRGIEPESECRPCVQQSS